MEINGIVSFVTDFGTADPYAGIVKGIVLGANPHANIADITHQIPAHDIISGAFTLVRSYRFFPEGTVHVAIVDPGVGKSRKSIAVKTERYLFVGPDNGILSPVLSLERIQEIREITNPPFLMDEISGTFHGRDVFAPCAGNLSAGKSFDFVGPEIKSIKHLVFPAVKCDDNVMSGEVVTVDSFGNLITNISKSAFDSFVGEKSYEVLYGNERFDTIRTSYSEVKIGENLALFDSCGYLEVSMNEGNAAAYFMTTAGSPVTVRAL